MIRGFATPQATRAWTRRHAPIAHTDLGRTGLTCTQVGFGGYRISRGMADHREALRLALGRGINLLDTSANYADGDSETLMGEVLTDFIADGPLTREAVIVVTKAGYLQGQNYALSQKRRQAGNPFPDLVPYAEGLAHCIHPDFLEDQITRSLARLNLACIDVLLLHNPEYYLAWAVKQGVASQAARKIYDDRIRLAFDHLEHEVIRGRIRFYGISSNTFPDAADRSDFTSLGRIHDLARDLRTDHHLAVVQFPMNLFECGAALVANQPDGRPLLAAARGYGLGTLVNRPLNALAGGRLMRLADVPDLPPQPAEAVIEHLQALAASERHFLEAILPNLGANEAMMSRITRQLRMAEALAAHYDGYGSYDNWLQIQSDHLMPRVRGVLAYVNQQSTPKALASWTSAYREGLNEALAAVTAHYIPAAASRVAAIRKAVRQADPDWNAEGPLSQLAIRALRSTQGISAVLVGMRRPIYVEDVVAGLAPGPAVKNRQASWAKLNTRLTALN